MNLPGTEITYNPAILFIVSWKLHVTEQCSTTKQNHYADGLSKRSQDDPSPYKPLGWVQVIREADVSANPL